MRNRIHDRTYRSSAELIRAIRDVYVLTQDELAGRTGLSRYQLCRWENGVREPTLAMLRQVLGEFGLAVTFTMDPSTAALDERLALGTDAIGLDSWLPVVAGEPCRVPGDRGGSTTSRRRRIRGGPARRSD